MFFKLTIFAIICIARYSEATLPPDVTGCSVSLTPTAFDACVKKNWDIIKHHTVNALPYMSLKRMDSFDLDKYSFARSTYLLSINGTFTNYKSQGLSQVIIDKVHVDPKLLTVDAMITIPKLAVTSNFDMTGKVVLISLPRYGVFQGDFANTTVHITAKLKSVIENGIERLSFEKYNLNVNLGSGTINLTSPTQADQAQGDKIVSLWKFNRYLFLSVSGTVIDSVSTGILRQALEQSLASLTKSELLLP